MCNVRMVGLWDQQLEAVEQLSLILSEVNNTGMEDEDEEEEEEEEVAAQRERENCGQSARASNWEK